MSFNNVQKEKLLADTGRLCCICKERHQVQLHHIISLTDGGSDDIENAIPLCPNCHDEVHTGYHPGRVTQKYSPNELRLHRQNTIENIHAIKSKEYTNTTVPKVKELSETDSPKKILRGQINAEVEQNMLLLQQYKERLFKNIPASGQMPPQQLYNFADLEIPLWRRTVWEAYCSHSTDALTTIEFQKVLAIHGQLDSIVGLKSIYQHICLEQQKIPAQKADLIKRNMSSSSMWNGLMEQERSILHRKNLVWMEMIEVFKKTLDKGNPIL